MRVTDTVMVVRLFCPEALAVGRGFHAINKVVRSAPRNP